MVRVTDKSETDSTMPKRAWAISALWAAVTITVLLVSAVALNAVIGRIIHWDIVAALGAISFVFLLIGRRYRTI